MKSYTLKSIGKNTDYMTILREMEDGFVVKIVRDMDGYEDIKTDYLQRQEQMRQEGIKKEVETYNKVINSLKQSDVNELIEDGILPEKLLPIIDENFQTGIFKSKKWGIQLGTIYDIIDKDFGKVEIEDE